MMYVTGQYNWFKGWGTFMEELIKNKCEIQQMENNFIVPKMEAEEQKEIEVKTLYEVELKGSPIVEIWGCNNYYFDGNGLLYFINGSDCCARPDVKAIFAVSEIRSIIISKSSNAA